MSNDNRFPAAVPLVLVLVLVLDSARIVEDEDEDENEKDEDTMSFLTPWFLLGALAIAGPIVFHLIRRAARERMPFSSLMFLRPTPPRITRRRRLEHVWLLLLRCLCLVLLAAAFARPYLFRAAAVPAPAAEARELVLLVDTSASLRREGLWSQALALAGRHLDRASPADRVAVMTFDQYPRTLVSFTEWSALAPDARAPLARQRLSAAAPGWKATHLGAALTGGSGQFDEAAADSGSRRRELVLITDLQEGASLDGLQGHEWPAGLKVTVECVKAGPGSNAGLEISEPPSATGAGSGPRVRVTNAADSSRERFKLAWLPENGGVRGEPAEIYLPPGQTRTFPAPQLPAGLKAGRLELSGDETDFDNVSVFAAPEADRVIVPYLGAEPASDPAGLRYFLERAFLATPRRQIELVATPANAGFSTGWLSQASFAVIPSGLEAEPAAAVRGWLAQGNTALLVLADAQMAPTLARLAGLPDARLDEAGGGYALLGAIDFAHPVFAPFADPRFSDFAHIHFWKHRRWEIPPSLPARVLAAFDDGSPALTQVPVGRGHLVVLASGWNPADSQLAVSSKFLPLMQRLLDWSGAAVPLRFAFRTGDAIPSPAGSGGPVTWLRPDGRTETLDAGVPFTATDAPGFYVASCGGKERRFAVNLPLEESRTAPRLPDDLARLGVPLQSGAEDSPALAAARQRQLQQSELEGRQKLWRWLIAGALAVTLAEILVGGWLARRVRTVEVAA